MKKIIIISIILTAITVPSIFIVYKNSRKQIIDTPHEMGIGGELRRIVLNAIAFKIEYDRWPKSDLEIIDYGKKQGEEIKFKCKSDGSPIHIIYDNFIISDKENRPIIVCVVFRGIKAIVCYSDARYATVNVGDILKNGLTSL